MKGGADQKRQLPDIACWDRWADDVDAGVNKLIMSLRELKVENERLRAFVRQCATDTYDRVSGGLKDEAKKLLDR